MTNQDLLNELSNNTWVIIKPSGIHGIGVFAVRDIPAGCREMFSKEMGEWATVPKADIEALPQHAKDIVENYCLYDEASYFLPAQGFKAIDLSLFLNHADIPNVVSVEDGAWFEALRDIKKGEELFVDYGAIVDGE